MGEINLSPVLGNAKIEIDQSRAPGSVKRKTDPVTNQDQGTRKRNVALGQETDPERDTTRSTSDLEAGLKTGEGLGQGVKIAETDTGRETETIILENWRDIKNLGSITKGLEVGPDWALT